MIIRSIIVIASLLALVTCWIVFPLHEVVWYSIVVIFWAILFQIVCWLAIWLIIVPIKEFIKGE